MIRTKKQFEPYFRKLAKLMNLGHWRLEFSDEEPRDNSLMSVACWQTRTVATIRLSKGVLTESAEEQRHCVVHELVHCIQAHPDHIIYCELHGDVYKAWDLAREYGVDATAALIAQFMPLP